MLALPFLTFLNLKIVFGDPISGEPLDGDGGGQGKQGASKRMAPIPIGSIGHAGKFALGCLRFSKYR
jgi:hypothetical protein